MNMVLGMSLQFAAAHFEVFFFAVAFNQLHLLVARTTAYVTKSLWFLLKLCHWFLSPLFLCVSLAHGMSLSGLKYWMHPSNELKIEWNSPARHEKWCALYPASFHTSAFLHFQHCTKLLCLFYLPLQFFLRHRQFVTLALFFRFSVCFFFQQMVSFVAALSWNTYIVQCTFRPKNIHQKSHISWYNEQMEKNHWLFDS